MGLTLAHTICQIMQKKKKKPSTSPGRHSKQKMSSRVENVRLHERKRKYSLYIESCVRTCRSSDYSGHCMQAGEREMEVH